MAGKICSRWIVSACPHCPAGARSGWRRAGLVDLVGAVGLGAAAPLALRLRLVGNRRRGSPAYVSMRTADVGELRAGFNQRPSRQASATVRFRLAEIR